MNEELKKTWEDAQKLAISEYAEEFYIEPEIAEECWYEELDKYEREDRVFTAYFNLCKERGLKPY